MPTDLIQQIIKYSLPEGRGLPLWFLWATYGTDRYWEAVECGIELVHIEVPCRTLKGSQFVMFALQKTTMKTLGLYTLTYENHDKGFALVTPTKWKWEIILKRFQYSVL